MYPVQSPPTSIYPDLCPWGTSPEPIGLHLWLWPELDIGSNRSVYRPPYARVPHHALLYPVCVRTVLQKHVPTDGSCPTAPPRLDKTASAMHLYRLLLLTADTSTGSAWLRRNTHPLFGRHTCAKVQDPDPDTTKGRFVSRHSNLTLFSNFHRSFIFCRVLC